MDFGDVVKEMKSSPGKRFRRVAWMTDHIDGGNEWIALAGATSESRPCLFWGVGNSMLRAASAYTATQGDILANDWQIVPGLVPQSWLR